VNICEKAFGGVPVRFVYLVDREALFVSKDDLNAAVRSCWASTVVAFDAMPVVLDGLDYFADGSEKAGAVLDVDTIGGVVNVFSAGNLLSAIADMDDVGHQDWRNFALRADRLFKWYAYTLVEVRRFYGLGFFGVIGMAEDHLDKHNPALSVTVSEHDGLWIAECDDIGLVTEADSFDELRDRVWEIASKLVELNGLDTPADDLRLHFAFVDSAAQHRMVE
jgi:hypothetical protein